MSTETELISSVPHAAESARPPFWSVLVPAYKPQFLRQALDSVLAQDPGAAEMEILVIDDASPNALEPIVRQAGGDRVRFIRQEPNRGTYPTINHLLDLSRGTWTHILNDDDWVLPGFYRTLRASLEQQPPTVGVGFCRCRNTDVQGRELWSPPAARATAGIVENWLQMIAINNPTHPVAVVVRRSVHERIGGYRTDLKFTGDWEFYLRCAASFQWWHEPQTLACYRQHEQNYSNAGMNSAEQIVELGRVIDAAAAYLPAENRAQIMAYAREYHALFALKEAHKSLEAANVLVAIRQLQEGLKLSTSRKVVDQLAMLLTHPGALAIRQMLPQWVQAIQLPP